MKICILLIAIILWGCNAKEQQPAESNTSNSNTVTSNPEPVGESNSAEENEKDENGYNKLTSEETYVIVNKGTEARFSGKYDKHYEKGLYTCKRCDH